MEEEVMPSVKAYERAGAAGAPLVTKMFDLKTGKEISDLGKLSDIDRLRVLADNTAANLELSAQSREEIQNIISSLPNPSIVNAVGLVLGYMALEGGEQTPRSVKRAVNESKKIQRVNVKPTDVVRYARYVSRF